MGRNFGYQFWPLYIQSIKGRKRVSSSMYSFDNHITIFLRIKMHQWFTRYGPELRTIVYITVSELRENKKNEFLADREFYRFSSFDQQHSPAKHCLTHSQFNCQCLTTGCGSRLKSHDLQSLPLRWWLLIHLLEVVSVLLTSCLYKWGAPLVHR